MSNPTYSESLAVQTAEENTALRQRLQQLAEEEEQRNANQSEEIQTDTSTVDRIKSQNTALNRKIADLEKELAVLKSINIQELYHDYTSLSARRGHLSNENAALRNVLSNQKKDVKKATKNVNNHQQMRRQNNEQNAASKADIQMFRERREALQKEQMQLAKDETRLEEELHSMPAHREEAEAEIRQLQEDNFKKDRLIEQLGNELNTQKGGEPAEGKSSEEDIAKLREEYVRLKEELKQAKQ